MLIGFMSEWMMSYRGAKLITAIAEFFFIVLVIFAVIGIVATIRYFRKRKAEKNKKKWY